MNKQESRTLISPAIEEKDLNYYMRMIRGDFEQLEESSALKVGGSASRKNVVVLFRSSRFGRGDSEIGETLMKHFLQAIIRSRSKPKAMIFSNEAVYIPVEGSKFFDIITAVAEQGVQILFCNESVEYYGLASKIKIGKLVDMDEICDNIFNAWKVITI